ncbi:MAG: hypothetical protein RJB38_1900 [Pseudomonadota bacterium]|jgi:hypothetical protein
MDWNRFELFGRLRMALSSALPALSSRPEFRRRLYGTLFLVTAITLGLVSSEALKDEAIEDWLSSNPPSLALWRTAAKERGLEAIEQAQEKTPWLSRAPRSFTPHSAWWDEPARALWVFSESAENPLDPPVFLLFAQTRKPLRARGFSSATGAEAQPLGQGWKALEKFQKLQIPPALSVPERSKAHPKLGKDLNPARRHPQEWIF